MLDDDEKMEVSVAPSKPPRRVLPEHERRYKVALPPGSHILAKQATGITSEAKLNLTIN